MVTSLTSMFGQMEIEYYVSVIACGLRACMADCQRSDIPPQPSDRLPMFSHVPLSLSFLVTASLPCNSDSFSLHPPIYVAFTSSC
jgi:hypothetical protein